VRPAQPTGTLPATRVPCPGAESTRRLPPRAHSRSCMLTNPAPRPQRLAWNPWPSSLTSKARAAPSAQTRTSSRARSPACLPAFWMASRQQK